MSWNGGGRVALTILQVVGLLGLASALLALLVPQMACDELECLVQFAIPFEIAWFVAAVVGVWRDRAWGWSLLAISALVLFMWLAGREPFRGTESVGPVQLYVVLIFCAMVMAAATLGRAIAQLLVAGEQ